MADNSLTKTESVAGLDWLRDRISATQRSILDMIWAHVRDKGVGIPERPLFRLHKRNVVIEETKALGGTIVRSGHENGEMRYNIGFVGIFLTSDGPKLERLVKRYLQYLKIRSDEDPDIQRISSKDLAYWEPPLSESELNELRAITTRSLGSFASSFGGASAEEWGISINTDVVELVDVTDWDGYIGKEIMRWYDSAMPVPDMERGMYGMGGTVNPFQSVLPSSKLEAKEFPTLLDLSFIDDEPLRKILESDWAEANRLIQVNAWKSIIIMSGGILEGLLIWRLGTARCETNFEDYEDWSLSDLIKECKKSALLKKQDEQLSDWAREYRNVIHPANQKKYERKIERSHAMIAFHFVDAIASSFRP